MRNKKVALLAVLLAGVISLSACAGTQSKKGSTSTSESSQIKASDVSKSPDAAKSRKDTMVISTTDMNGIWSKDFSNSSYDWYACEVMFDYLINPTADGKPEASAATYKVSPDGLTYTFTLKDGVKYWDGKAATAKDIEFWLYVESDPNYDGQVDLSTVNIKGFNDYKTGSATTISGIKVVDDKTIQITLDQPNAPGLWNLAVPLMEKDYYGPNFKKGDAAAVEKKISDDKPMGTGQYKFVSYDPSTGLKLTANDSYFKGAPKIKNLEFAITAQGKELQAVQAGQVDFANATCSQDNITSLTNSKFISAQYFPANLYGMIQWNLQDDKYKDVQVRQALAYALDRKAIVKTVYGPYGKVNNVPIPQSSWGYTDKGITAYDYNIDKAKALLKEAGWNLDPSTNKLMKDGKPFVIDFTATSGNSVTDVMLPVMKSSYGKLGIDVNIETADFATILKNYNKGKLDACFMGQNLGSPDPDQSVGFMTGGTQNFYKYSNANLDKLFKQELTETDTAKRTQIFYQIDKILNNDLPQFPIYQRNDLWVYNGRISNVQNMGAFRDPFYDFYLYEIKG